MRMMHHFFLPVLLVRSQEFYFYIVGYSGFHVVYWDGTSFLGKKAQKTQPWRQRRFRGFIEESQFN